ncbi:MAG: ubiquitin-like domain-containing protein [Oscillospiraceae bacterium]|nr:ubiquitin-like domain-containing protein [Oscillospiraceae bacterium]
MDTGTNRITEEDIIRAKKIKGLISEKTKTAMEELVDICEMLDDKGMDLTKTGLKKDNKHKTVNDIVEEQGIDPKVLEYIDGDYPIGKKIAGFRNACKGKSSYAVTEEDKARAKKIKGLVPENKKTATEILLDTCELLDRNKVDFTKVQLTKNIDGKDISITVGEILKEQNIELSKEDLKKVKLDYKIGQSIIAFRKACKGTSKRTTTEEEKARGKAIKGIIVEEEKTVIEEVLDVCEVLSKNKVDFTKLALSKNVDGKTTYKTVGDIIQEQGIEEKYEALKQSEEDEEVLKQLDEAYKALKQLDEDYEVGHYANILRRCYVGSSDYKITAADRTRAEAIDGLLTKEKKPVFEELLDACEFLKANEVSFINIRISKKGEDGKNVKKTVKDILEEQGKDKSILDNLEGIDENYEIGKRINHLRCTYRGTLDYPLTEEDILRVEALERTDPGNSKKRKTEKTTVTKRSRSSKSARRCAKFKRGFE